jgi:hypothetical protein
MSDVYLNFRLFGGSRCQMYIYALGCSMVLDVRCIFMLSLFSSSRRQMYIHVLVCSVVLDVRCIFKLSVVRWF